LGANVNQSDINLFDMGHIEVLRGPQGTLYGAGSQGGTIRYISNKPDFNEVGGALELDMAHREGASGQIYSYNAMVNIPVVEDKFAVRAVLFRNESDGYVDFPSLNLNDVGDISTKGGRLIASWKVSENTKIIGSAWYQELDAEDSGWIERGGDFRTSRVIEPAYDELKMYNVTLDHQFDHGLLTATSSLQERETFFVFDVSQFFTPVPGFPASVNQVGLSELQSHEIRYASQLNGPIQFIVGGFYQNRDTPEGGLGNGYFGDPTTGLPIVSTQTQFFGSSLTEEYTNKAVFGELIYQPSDQWEIIFGARSFKLESESQSTETFTPFGTPAGEGPILRSSHSDSVFKFQVTHYLSEDTLMYAVYSEGYREGGANQRGLISAGGEPVPATYEPDLVENYEFGWKSTLLDGQVKFNGAVYLMDWDEIQVPLTEINGAFPYVENAGSAELYGIELEAAFYPNALEGFSLSLNYGYASQELTEDSESFRLGNPNGGRDGDKLAGAPDHSFGLIMDQRFTKFGYDSFISFDASYSGKSLTTLSAVDPSARDIGGYILAGGRLGVQGDNWLASLYVRNLFDRRAPTTWSLDSFGILPDRVRRTAPRTIGLNLKLEF
jgi:outer membrane receptor protein involved in Fe transport